MSVVILILAAAVLALLEKFWAPWALKALHREGRCDRYLAEPGETLIWTSRVENRGKLPIPFVRLREEVPAGACIREDRTWVDLHCRKSSLWWHTENKFSLSPRQRAEKRIRFSLPGRGVYRIGGGSIGAGDLLGFREESRECSGENIVVMPSRSENARNLEAAGGFIGDISVRRFILEDPILTVGFRDYTGREPLKSVSWTRTAMTGHMQVKQYDHTSEQTAVVLLNVSGAYGEVLEECFRLARSVCEELERKKIPFSLRTNGNLPGPMGKLFVMPEGLGESHLNTILYALGRADDTCFYSLATLVRQTLRARKVSDAYIVITPVLAGEERGALTRLETAGGNPLCVLEVESQ